MTCFQIFEKALITNLFADEMHHFFGIVSIGKIVFLNPFSDFLLLLCRCGSGIRPENLICNGIDRTEFFDEANVNSGNIQLFHLAEANYQCVLLRGRFPLFGSFFVVLFCRTGKARFVQFIPGK